MQCPKCKSIIPDDSMFCQVCGGDTRGDAASCRSLQDDSFSALGDLDAADQDDGTDANGDHAIDSSLGGNRTRVHDAGEDGLCRDKEADCTEPPIETTKRDTLFCTGCGKPTPGDAIFCEYCGKKLLPDPTKGKLQWKKSMTIAICCTALWIGVLIIFCGWLGQDGSVPAGGDSPNEDRMPLCDTCDYTLCRGTDVSGNTYELVANQTESALGYEIMVGVIKNNEWIYPLSADFPFLGEDGLFHVGGAGKSGTSLAHVNTVIQSIYFIDSGAFLLDCYTETDSWLSSPDHIKIIFSCDSLKSYTINCKEATILYRYSEATFSNGLVTSYGRIPSENGTFILYSETSGTSSGWLEDQVFKWYTLNVQTLEVETLAANIAGVRPESILSEGLIFASDQCFYNTSVQKVIDLSAYDIDMWYSADIFFEGGTCTFTAENELGTEFLITIDKSGNVISEIEK